jgi:hypothetical protein
MTPKSRFGCRCRTTQQDLRSVAASVSCVLLLKTSPPSKLQLWLLRAALRSCKRHCVVLKNQALITWLLFMLMLKAKTLFNPLKTKRICLT